MMGGGAVGKIFYAVMLFGYISVVTYRKKTHFRVPVF